MLGLAIASGVAPIVGGILGNSANKKAMAAAQAALAQAREIIDQVGAPPDLSAAIIMDQFQQVGLLTPEMEQAIQLGVSRVAKIEEDKSLRDAQVNALKELQQRGRTGVTAEEQAQFNVSRQGVQRDLEAKQQQLKQDLAMRGQAGSGAEIAARLLSSQESADRASEEADRINALAASRALEAISRSGDLGGNIRGQDFQVESTKAGAQDEFDRFNVQNQIGREQRNVGSRNVAQEKNLDVKQQVHQRNVETANQERLRQAEAKRQHWLDSLEYARARANPYGQQAQMEMQSGQNKAQMWSGIGSGVGSAFGSLANYYGNKSSAPAQRKNYVEETGYWNK